MRISLRPAYRVVAWRGYPSKLRMDNGPEFISTILADLAQDHIVDLTFNQPGKPTQNASIKRFNRTFRDEALNVYLLYNPIGSTSHHERRLDQYSEDRPNKAPGDLRPSNTDGPISRRQL